MSNDNKTLADVQPGGMVRLGDVLPPLPKMQRFTNLYGETYAYSAEQMRDYARAALSAQPSPGGQDARAQFEAYRGGDFERDAQGYYTNARTAQDWAMWQAALATRQPVGQIPAGFVLVPEKFGIPAEVWEGVEFVIGGPGTGEGEAYLDSTAWVGDLIQDDGSAVYGLHLSCDECPEEGSVTLSEFTARAEVQP